jgi:hypothetical protein
MEPEVQIRRRRNRKKGIVLYIFLFFIALMIITASIFAYLTLQNDRVYKGVTVSGIDASGLSKQQLQAELEAKYQVPGDGTGITLKASDAEISLAFAELELMYDIETAVKNAYAVGRTGNIF